MVDRIKFLCTQNGTTIQKLEQATGLGNGTIRRWDNAAPSVDRLAAVASYFGVTMEYLLTGTVGAIPEGLASRRHESPEKKQPTVTDGLSEDEAMLLSAFRALPEAERASVLLLLRRAATPAAPNPDAPE